MFNEITDDDTKTRFYTFIGDAQQKDFLEQTKKRFQQLLIDEDKLDSKLDMEPLKLLREIAIDPGIREVGGSLQIAKVYLSLLNFRESPEKPNALRLIPLHPPYRSLGKKSFHSNRPFFDFFVRRWKTLRYLADSFSVGGADEWTGVDEADTVDALSTPAFQEKKREEKRVSMSSTSSTAVHWRPLTPPIRPQTSAPPRASVSRKTETAPGIWILDSPSSQRSAPAGPAIS